MNSNLNLFSGKYQYFVFNLKRILNSFLFGLIIFSIFRLVFFLRFNTEETIKLYHSDTIAAFVVGLRFDILVLCYLIALPVLGSLILLFISKGKIYKLYEKFSVFYFSVVYPISFLLLIVDQQYFTYFQTHFSVIFFGFFEDDTNAVLTSMWTDHPVFSIIVLQTLLCLISIFLVRKIWIKPFLNQKSTLSTNVVYTSIYFLSFALGLRGSLGVFPLNLDDASVSENGFVNLLPINGIFSLKNAFKERSDAQKYQSPSEILENGGFRNIQNLIGSFYGLDEKSIKRSYLDYLFKKTPVSPLLEKQKPDVVFVLMESFGGYFLNFHSQKMNLLGSLEKHLNEDYFFRNFLSSNNGTIYSLESIVTNSTGWPLISNTSQRFYPQESSIAYPFKMAGYETIFITTGSSNWRNLHELLPSMYFDRILGSSYIKKNFPEAQEKTWGVSDEYLYKQIMSMLNEKSSKPKLIFALTTINHTPYEFPSTYKGYPIQIPDSIKKVIIANADLAHTVFKSYQYGCNSLGDFISDLKAGANAQTTIVGATGDHNSYTLFPLESELGKGYENYRVPFYLYLPESLKQNKHATSDRYGSHKDIWPTIIPHALSGQRYFTLGNNLLEPDSVGSFFYGENERVSLAPEDVSKAIIDGKINARRALIDYYFSDHHLKYLQNHK